MPNGWRLTVDQLARAVTARDEVALTRLIASGAPVQPFDSDTTATPRDVVKLLSGAALVSTRAYAVVPQAFATDLAADAKAAKDLPDALRAALTPANSEALVKANATAAEWFSLTLQPARGQMIAALTFYRAPADPADANPAARGTLLFALARADLAPDGSWQIKQLAYGDPTPALPAAP